MQIEGDLSQIAARLRHLCLQEKSLQLETLDLINYLHDRDAALVLGYASWESFASYLGLTPNQYWKRLQAARVVRLFPQFKEHLRTARTCVSHLALAAPKITDKNAGLIEAGLCDKKRRDVELFLSRIRPDGSLSEVDVATLEVKFLLNSAELALLQRGREILSAKGQVPSEKEVVLRSLQELISRRDPAKKAARALTRGQASKATGIRKSSTTALPRPEGLRARIPASTKYQVFSRDGGRCTFENDRGERCPERSMLEYDHIEMHCRGGVDTAENLRLRCRYHNQASARQELGR